MKAQDAASQAGVQWKEAKAAFDAGDYARAGEGFNSVIRISMPAVLTWVDDTSPTPPPRPSAGLVAGADLFHDGRLLFQC